MNRIFPWLICLFFFFPQLAAGVEVEPNIKGKMALYQSEEDPEKEKLLGKIKKFLRRLAREVRIKTGPFREQSREYLENLQKYFLQMNRKFFPPRKKKGEKKAIKKLRQINPRPGKKKVKEKEKKYKSLRDFYKNKKYGLNKEGYQFKTFTMPAHKPQKGRYRYKKGPGEKISALCKKCDKKMKACRCLCEDCKKIYPQCTCQCKGCKKEIPHCICYRGSFFFYAPGKGKGKKRIFIIPDGSGPKAKKSKKNGEKNPEKIEKK